MRQFRTYSIYANVPSAALERQRERLIGEFKEKGDEHMWRWLESTGRRIEEVTPDLREPAAAMTWESEVMKQLGLIASNPVGKLVLDQINYLKTVWILPFEAGSDAQCTCRAFTFPSGPKEREGIRIYYNPSYSRDGDKWIGSDDILLHELVHAYRMSTVGYCGMNWRQLNNFDDAEEFYATQIQNVYLSFRGSPLYYKWYSPLTQGTFAEVYDYLTGEDPIMAFKWFLDNEKLARLLSAWSVPKFNPWRDFSGLEKQFLDYMRKGGYTMPPPFGYMTICK